MASLSSSPRPHPFTHFSIHHLIHRHCVVNPSMCCVCIFESINTQRYLNREIFINNSHEWNNSRDVILIIRSQFLVIFTSCSFIHSQYVKLFAFDSCSCHFASFAWDKIILCHHHFALGRTEEKSSRVADSSSFIKKETPDEKKNNQREKQHPLAISLTGWSSRIARNHLYLRRTELIQN